MKKITILILSSITLLLACDMQRSPLKKPFVIIYKFPNGLSCNGVSCTYKYEDANGTGMHFCENENKYSVGDTIY